MSNQFIPPPFTKNKPILFSLKQLFSSVCRLHAVRFPARAYRVTGFSIIMLIASVAWIGCKSLANEKNTPATDSFDAATLHLQTNNSLVMQNEKPFTGIVYTLHENKKDTLSIVEYRLGREQGKWKTFYNNGSLKSIRFYDNGKKTGVYRSWWQNGNQQLAYYFKEGEYEGACREWNDKGVLINERTYKDGYENGPQKQFDDSGYIKSNYVMVNGKRFGLLGTKNCVNVADSVFKN